MDILEIPQNRFVMFLLVLKIHKLSNIFRQF